MQSTGQARAHLSHPMQVVRSNRWNPRYRGRTGTGRSGYSKCWVNALRRNDWTKYHRVTYMPRAIVPVARATFRNQVRMGVGAPGGVGSGVAREFYVNGPAGTTPRAARSAAAFSETAAGTAG